MPELPEVEALAGLLSERLRGKEVTDVELGAISALKTVTPPLESLEGRQFAHVGRRGKMLVLEMADESRLWLVCHLSRGGWVHWRDRFSDRPVRRGRGPLALRVRLGDGSGFDLTEAGREKRLAIWVVGDPESVERVATLGPDPLAPEFDESMLAQVFDGAGTLKSALSDQARIAGIGNAYSDEILHAAQMSPFKPAGNLSKQELRQLYESLRSVLAEAVERSRGVGISELKDDKRSSMSVHGQTGQPCPVCGDVVREVSFSSRSLQYCATC